MRSKSIVTLSLGLLLAACSSDGNSGGGGSSGSGGNNGGQGSGGGGGPINFGGGLHTGPMFAGTDCPSDLGLPDAYGLPNVKGVVTGNTVRITFDPQGDAQDYRVYRIPSKDQVSGSVIKDAVYRCAGRYAVPRVAQEDAAFEGSPGIRTRVASKVGGIERKLEEATLGYVFTTPGDGRVPVYALGDPHPKADNVGCYEMRFPESRVKIYTSSEEERAELLGQHWRDDGIVFYAPEPGTAGTEPLFEARQEPSEFSSTTYMKGGEEYDSRVDAGAAGREAFSVYSESVDGAEPLMRVFYAQTCGQGHDELVTGSARFNKAYAQGDSPVTTLHFSGISEETTLVVEALDAQCPFQGTLSPTSRPARSDDFDDFTIDYPAFETPEELAAKSADGELYINGQGEPGAAPKAISRGCLTVEPEQLPAADFRYEGEVETFSEGSPRNFQIWDTESPTFDVHFMAVATDQWAIGSMFGELWVTYADWAADTNGKLRITPKARATLADDSFVHATMAVDIVSSQRRYPQLLISDVEVPVQDNLPNGTTVVIQTFGGITTPVAAQIQFCDHRNWDVNNQCPTFDLTTLERDGESFLAPRPEINGWMAVDEVVRFDAYVSTSRVYLYTNGVPYGCADLPAGKLPAGPATVTYGDVLYHSSVDLEDWYPFHQAKMHVLTSRHYSNLSFTSNTMPPAWDEQRFPCAAVSALKDP